MARAVDPLAHLVAGPGLAELAGDVRPVPRAGRPRPEQDAACPGDPGRRYTDPVGPATTGAGRTVCRSPGAGTAHGGGDEQRAERPAPANAGATGRMSTNSRN